MQYVSLPLENRLSENYSTRLDCQIIHVRSCDVDCKSMENCPHLLTCFCSIVTFLLTMNHI